MIPKNNLRTREYMKIKRSINRCTTDRQLGTCLTMIAAHPYINESDALMEIYKLKEAELNPESFGEKFEKAAHYEDETLTSIHARNCGAH